MSNRLLNLAMIGLGGWGRNVVRSFGVAARCRLQYLCDAVPATLDSFRGAFPHAQFVDDYRIALDDPSVDAVAVVTPAHTHHAVAKAALEAGKHVYVEKPMTLTSADALDLLATAERVDRKLMVGHLLRYHPGVEAMKREIDAGTIGEVRYMVCRRLNLGVVRRHENAFASLAPHDISIILHLFDDEPTRISARGGCYLQPDVHDVVFADLQFADGRLAHIHSSWLDPAKERKMVVVGSERMMVFDEMEPVEKLRIFDKGADRAPAGAAQGFTLRNGDAWTPAISTEQPLDVETRHFVDCVLDDVAPRSDGADGLRVVRILEEVDRLLRADVGAAASAVPAPSHLRRIVSQAG